MESKVINVLTLLEGQALTLLAKCLQCADAKLTCSRQSLCVVNDQPVGNPKRKV
jgi:hypothetical protein